MNRSHCQGSFSEILVTQTRPLTFLTQRLMDVSTRVKLAHRFARQVTVLWVVIGCKVPTSAYTSSVSKQVEVSLPKCLFDFFDLPELSFSRIVESYMYFLFLQAASQLV